MKKNFRKLLVLLAFAPLAACEKVIDLKVGDSTPQTVIEGDITDDRVPMVRITKTVSFTQPNQFPMVKNARVILYDRTAGTSDTLREFNTGNDSGYSSSTGNRGIPGHTYELHVEAEGKTYTAVSTMPQPVPIDSVYTITQEAFGNKAAQVYLLYRDPAGIPNYYRCVARVRGYFYDDVRDDRLTDGRINGRPLIVPYEESVVAGDTATIELRGLDEGAYRYFSTFFDAEGSSAAPANPTGNISGGALGYFSAQNVQRRTIVLE